MGPARGIGLVDAGIGGDGRRLGVDGGTGMGGVEFDRGWS
uniref:Uncharacterized protein n=1 Tax=Arundo donax TaxID=35708 RepID=A0A0A8ZJ97_ARUDO